MPVLQMFALVAVLVICGVMLLAGPQSLHHSGQQLMARQLSEMPFMDVIGGEWTHEHLKGVSVVFHLVGVRAHR